MRVRTWAVSRREVVEEEVEGAAVVVEEARTLGQERARAQRPGRDRPRASVGRMLEEANKLQPDTRLEGRMLQLAHKRNRGALKASPLITFIALTLFSISEIGIIIVRIWVKKVVKNKSRKAIASAKKISKCFDEHDIV